ncbi:hypothetical protein CMQ_3336 [Grosmannia clavigera kw1407]|uniref:Uncharacterized protein n=1 Tax=Grosmannia clavigera (strain kw1407 / UAMH 11150) TaxID=655863 RepID=F0X825_GROCL|nr:uncharacterized protein CMQ_3336 [Grosmannia clavigera kw1407]EFX05267.1 hypothetical protein CMQ_3336 [Grosmannia clavigera kw1407]
MQGMQGGSGVGTQPGRILVDDVDAWEVSWRDRGRRRERSRRTQDDRDLDAEPDEPDGVAPGSGRGGHGVDWLSRGEMDGGSWVG